MEVPTPLPPHQAVDFALGGYTLQDCHDCMCPVHVQRLTLLGEVSLDGLLQPDACQPPVPVPS